MNECDLDNLMSEAEKRKEDIFYDLSDNDVFLLLKHVIGLRIAQRASGSIQDGQQTELRQEIQDLYSYDFEKMKIRYRFHYEQYLAEKISHD